MTRRSLILSLSASLVLLSSTATFAVAKEIAQSSISPVIANPFTKTETSGKAPSITPRLEKSTSSSAASSLKDTWQEYIQQQNQQISDFRQKINTEIKEKKKSLEEERKACKDQLSNFAKQRVTDRKQLMQSCMPKEPTKDEIKAQMTTTGASASGVLAGFKQQRQDCLAKLKTFEQETKTMTQSIKDTCKQTERKVLGLSTSVSY